MPFIDQDSFSPPRLYRHGHYNTIVPNILGKVTPVQFERQRISTPDEDFLDLDFINRGHDRIAILCHGLEGSTASKYIRDIALGLISDGWDICGMNYRSCSGEMNRQLRMYNSGSTDDLHTVVESIKEKYQKIALVGISLGGNLILKYLGDGVFPISDKLKSAVAISAPVALHSASLQLLKKQNIPYQINFLRTLLLKVYKKAKMFPGQFQTYPWYKTLNLFQFDDLYTAPVHGYRDAADYYAQCSSNQFLDNIKVPTLLFNAANDPFLSEECYPLDVSKHSDYFHFLLTQYGGHVGFAKSRNDQSFMVDTVIEFFRRMV